MKRVVFVLFIAITALFSGCEGVSVEPTLNLAYSQSNTVVMDSSGDSKTVLFETDHDWYAEISGGDGWLTADQMQGTSEMTRIKITASENTDQKRTAVLKISCSDDIFVTVNIEQDSFEPTFELKGANANVSAAANSFAVEVIADIDYTYVIKADWISDTAPKAPLGHKHIFYAESNPQAQERSGEIVFESSVGTLTFTVTQRPAGTEKDDWQYGNFVHRSLAMRFTADWCGYCPMMAEAFNNAKGQMSGHLEVVSMHGSGGLAFSETSALERQFGVQGYPTGIVDGRAMIPNYNSTAVTAQAATDVARETQAACPANVGIAASSSNVLREMDMDLTLYFKEADTYKVTILLLEDNIVGYQNGVVNSNNYVHNDVARAALTPIKGEIVKIEEDNTVWEKSYTGKIPSKCVLDNMRVLVIVDRAYPAAGISSEVETAEYIPGVSTYVANCVSFRLGSSVELEFAD